ncbi:hypothetical protein SB394_07235 [Burkholderia sp. BCCIQ04A]|uniref:Uncharacterized protein n=1 Tax=Burkholderia anthinoferrum TaxID=3090833 RepID=A0ABU5WGC7_9BURK|nr:MULTISPECIES: hypothetical protein [Burkholderia]MEB2502255.1 hypothetical protein [Burkholderia anthinoferrum]MEB2530579.1 hypothetical protein [Burkholderia anthinoferrum]MEB2559318.1 hypothetical protein [Burkholderia anthinoferrum]MEB2578066.1 hypothetical protein [Burkholderia anthinoferrum]KVH10975.1 hypothetical protein WS85_16775 [Burkholderia anthina]
MNTRRQCRLPKGLTGRRAGRGGAAPIGRLRGARRIAPQIVLHVPRNTRRFCVLSGAERRANDFLP